MSWGYEKLSIIAPSKPLKHPVISNSEKVWMLNLDMVEANSGQVIGKQKSPLSTAGSSTHWFDTSHVLYSKLRPYLNKVVMPDEEGLATTELVPLKPDSKRLDRAYLAYYLRSKTFVDWISEQVAGAKMPRVSMNVFWNHEIPIPFPDEPAKSLAEQKRIAAILDKADAIRRKRQQAIKLADDFLRSVFLDMFGDPIANNKKWNVVNLGELAPNKGDMVDGPFGSSVNTKTDYIDDGEIPVIRTKNVSFEGEFVCNDLKFMTREKFLTIHRSHVIPGDIVLTKVGTIGNVCIFPEKYKEAVLSTTGSCRIRIDELMINKDYLFFFLKYYRPKMHEIASAGVQPFLNMKHIKGFEVPMPSMELQSKFSTLVKQVTVSKAKLKEASESQLFNSLSQKAFAGEL